MMLNLTKTTSCGRFIVTIQSTRPQDEVFLVTDGAASLKELSDVLAETSQLALETALRVLNGEVDVHVIHG